MLPRNGPKSPETKPAPLPCHRCGAVDQPRLAPGSGPHFQAATCQHCGRFIQWISQHNPEERHRRRQTARQEAMQRKPASVMQLQFLAALGDPGPAPASMAQASERLAALVAENEVRHA